MNSKTQPMRARIAGRVTPSSQSSSNSLEMIELPVKKTPDVITCCQVSGNILIGSHKTLVLYKFCVRTHDISKLKFIDFEESLTFEVSFCPSTISLCENLVSCLSKENFHVFKVIYKESNEGNNQVKKNSSERKDSESVDFQRRQKKRGGNDNSRNSKCIDLDQLMKYTNVDCRSFKEEVKEKLFVHSDSFPIVVYLPTIVEENKSLSANQMVNIQKRAGPFCDAPLEMQVKVCKDSLPQTEGVPDICNLLQLQILACSKTSKEEFRCMNIKPMYVTSKECSEGKFYFLSRECNLTLTTKYLNVCLNL